MKMSYSDIQKVSSFFTPTGHSKRGRGSDYQAAPKKPRVDNRLAWSDAFRMTLATEEQGSKIKLSVTIGVNQADEVKCIRSHIRRYKKEFPTVEGVSLKMCDLDAISNHQEPKFEVTFPDHTFKATSVKDTLVKLEVANMGNHRNISFEFFVWQKIQSTINAIKYIVSNISKFRKEHTSYDCTLSIYNSELDRLCMTNAGGYSLEQDLELIQEPASQKLAVAERTLRIPEQMTRSVIAHPDFQKRLLDYNNYDNQENRESNDSIVRIILKNEAFEM